MTTGWCRFIQPATHATTREIGFTAKINSQTVLKNEVFPPDKGATG